MGFSLVIEAMIEAKKPIIGHNCMYDWLYLYNQFIAKLPETFLDFATEWTKLFPYTFDTKVLAFNSKHFFKTALGTVYEKCTTDEKHKNNLKFRFDLKNGFGNYDGTSLLSHYHEAAYDAYMTGVAFGTILKIKEIDDIKFMEKKAQKDPSLKAGLKSAKQLKNSPVDLSVRYPNTWVNKLMMDAFGSERYYNLVPELHLAFVKTQEDNAEFPTTVHLTFKSGFIGTMTAKDVSKMFMEYGDFYLFKDTKDSVFMEFFFLDKEMVKDQKLETFISMVKKEAHLQVVEGCLHEQAPRFK